MPSCAGPCARRRRGTSPSVTERIGTGAMPSGLPWRRRRYLPPSGDGDTEQEVAAGSSSTGDEGEIAQLAQRHRQRREVEALGTADLHVHRDRLADRALVVRDPRRRRTVRTCAARCGSARRAPTTDRRASADRAWVCQRSERGSRPMPSHSHIRSNASKIDQ